MYSVCSSGRCLCRPVECDSSFCPVSYWTLQSHWSPLLLWNKDVLTKTLHFLTEVFVRFTFGSFLLNKIKTACWIDAAGFMHISVWLLRSFESGVSRHKQVPQQTKPVLDAQCNSLGSPICFPLLNLTIVIYYIYFQTNFVHT